MTEAGETVTLKTLLNFFSGLEKPPPFGFTLKPTLQFVGGDYASAAVCSYEMKLPLGPVTVDYEEFKKSMTLSLMGHDGFGVV